MLLRESPHDIKPIEDRGKSAASAPNRDDQAEGEEVQVLVTDDVRHEMVHSRLIPSPGMSLAIKLRRPSAGLKVCAVLIIFNNSGSP
jgi:hypothetical protein